jgi:citrate lyase beta subunit
MSLYGVDAWLTVSARFFALLAVIPMIETAEGLKNVNEIASVPVSVRFSWASEETCTNTSAWRRILPNSNPPARKF